MNEVINSEPYIFPYVLGYIYAVKNTIFLFIAVHH
jgi:hypothetical protein